MLVLTAATFAAAALSLGGAAVAASAATGSSFFCNSVTANNPYKASSGQAYATGSWSCPSSGGRKAVLEIHHVSGWWHPCVAGNTVDAVYNGSISGSGCYPSQSGNQAEYFNQVRLQNSSQTGDWVISSNSSFRIGC